MVKDRLYVFCFSHEDFNDYMRMSNLFESPDSEMAVISICSQNDDDPFHWFQENPYGNVLNIDFDDMDPSIWWRSNMYDILMDKYLDGKNVDDEFKFYVDDCQSCELHAMTYNQAEKITNYIRTNIDLGIRKFFIHCSAGVSRSQGVVRYIMDTYGNEFQVITRKENPCITPNIHVVRMLKRVDRFKR